jgi:F-type H+-transporting ATPase subunit gamma
MPSLKEIRNRITSVGSTMQITSAMKMVSAAKLKKAQDAITQMRPYSEKLQEILSNLSSSMDISTNPYTSERQLKNILIIAVSSNRGLCGGFNNNIIKRVNLLLNEYSDVNVNILCLGKKIKDTYKKTANYYINDNISEIEDIFSNFSFDNISIIANDFMNRFSEKEFDKVIVVYNKFINAATQHIITEQILPIVKNQQKDTNSNVEYIFEPSKEEIVESLIPKSLRIQLFKALLDSNAAEHGARMTAMHKATDNAKELQRSLKLSYNKARQASITNEILEIVGGAEALKS